MSQTVTILFGTETGTAFEIAQAVANRFQRSGAAVALDEMDAIPVAEWAQHSPLILICSTTGQGEIPHTMKKSWDVLRMSDAPDTDGLRYAVFGLGDSTYTKFNFAAKMLHNRLSQLGGSPIVHRGLGDEQDKGGHDEALVPWLAELLKGLSMETKSSTSVPSNLQVDFAEDGSDSMLPVRQVDEVVAHVKVCANKRITSEDHFQTVHHIEVQKHDNLKYECGDVLRVYPTNPSALVSRFLKRMKLNGSSRVVLSPNSDVGSLKRQPHNSCFGVIMSLEHLLTHQMELNGTGTRRFLSMLSTFATDEEDQERLLELSESSHLDEFHAFCYREKRNFVEILEDFAQIEVPLKYVLSCIPPLKPRLFSISSSPLDDAIAITVAKLEFTTPYGRKRTGLCSGLLCEVKKDEILECSIARGTIHVPQPAKPLILIGPGTGIAPIRSIVRWCAKTEYPCDVLLFTGNRFKEKDYLYGEEFQALTKGSSVSHFPSFSRDGDKCRYVQHRMAEVATAKMVGAAIANEAVVILCGNSKQMPNDVDTSLKSIIHHFVTKGEEAEAEMYLKTMKRSERFFSETWSS